MDSVFRYVNTGGNLFGRRIPEGELAPRIGWTVTGRVRRGRHRDEGLESQSVSNYGSPDKDTDSSGLMYHVVNITPSFYPSLVALKSHQFDSSSLVESTSLHARHIVRATRPGTAAVNVVSPPTVRPRARARLAALRAASAGGGV